MTPDQRQVIDTLKARITRMREGGQPDSVIEAGLTAQEGWPIGEFREAVKELDAAKEGAG